MLTLIPSENTPKAEEIIEVPVSTTVDLFLIYRRCLELENLCEQLNGTSISAVQAGIPWKLFLVKSDGSLDFASKNTYGYFVNCDYEPTTNSQRVVPLESCLSLRSSNGRLRHFQVERHSEISLRGHRLNIINNKLVIENINWIIEIGKQGVVFQHEIDHGKRVLITDIGKEFYVW